MLRSSISLTISVPSLSMQIAVDDRGALTQLESGVDIGEASEADQIQFENYASLSKSCGGTGSKKNRGDLVSAGDLQSCHIACNHAESCVAFQFGEGKCTLFKERDVDLGAKNAFRCTSESCCWVQTMDFDRRGTVSVPGGKDDDEGRVGRADRIQLTQLSGFAAVNMTSEMEEFLTEHNKYRCMHGVAPLTWNPTMAQNAATWGNTCCQSSLQHSQSYNMNPSSGENLAAGYGSIAAAVAGWYNEVDDCGPFPGCTDGATGVVGHFTAMVWADSSQLGCALNPTGWKNSRLYVCHYAAGAPNYRNQYEGNVFAATKSESECSQGGSGPAPPSPPTSSGQYTFSAYKANSCNGGDHIQDKASCEAVATALGKSFFGQKSRRTWPYGCVQRRNQDDVAWNTNPANVVHSNLRVICQDLAAPPPSPTSAPTLAPTPVPLPPTSNCPGDRNPTTIRLDGVVATCAELQDFCDGYTFVQDQCPCTCNIPTPAPMPAPVPVAGAFGTCCDCTDDADCAVGFCCPQMKKCIPSSSQVCYTSPDCTPWDR